MVEAEGWLVFDDSKLVALKKTTRFSLKAGQRAVKLVLEYPESLFEDEYPEVRVPISDKREILDREIGVEIGGDEGAERQVVDPEQYIEDLFDRLIEEDEVRGLPRWAFAALREKLERENIWFEWEARMDETGPDEAERVIAILEEES